MQEHLGHLQTVFRLHLQTVFRLFVKHVIIISKKKIELCKTYINFLAVTLGEGKIKL